MHSVKRPCRRSTYLHVLTLIPLIVAACLIVIHFLAPCTCPLDHVRDRTAFDLNQGHDFIKLRRGNRWVLNHGADHNRVEKEVTTFSYSKDKVHDTTPQQSETIFKDLQVEVDDGVYDLAGKVTGHGLSDVMSNISMSDLHHMTWGDNFNVDDFQAWAQEHLNRPDEDRLQLPEITNPAETACNSETELIIVIPSSPGVLFTRELVRQTWASPIYGMPWPHRRLQMRTSLVFIIGTGGLGASTLSAIEAESVDYRDIVTADFIDSYRNLTLKMLISLDWVARFCPTAEYILKCDLDTFVNLPLLTRFVATVGQKLPRFVLGGRHDIVNPPVLRTGKWSIREEDYPLPKFPPHVMGHSYILTGGIAPQMVAMARKLPLIPSEDTFITGVLASLLRVTRLAHYSFASNYKRTLPCNILYNEDVTMTNMGLGQLLLMWRHIIMRTCSAEELPARNNIVKNQKRALNQNRTQMKQPQKQGNGGQAQENSAFSQDNNGKVLQQQYINNFIQQPQPEQSNWQKKDVKSKPLSEESKNLRLENIPMGQFFMQQQEQLQRFDQLEDAEELRLIELFNLKDNEKSKHNRSLDLGLHQPADLNAQGKKR